MTTYPKANRTAQWFGNAFSSTTWANPDKGTLHSTEGYGWPAYVRDGQAGAAAPNYTARPNFTTKTLDWRAHFEDQESSRALVNLSGGVSTNTDKNVQVELIGTCDPKHRTSWNGAGSIIEGKDYIFWPAAPDWALIAVADFIKYMHVTHGIPLSGMAIWLAYPASAGATGNRMTFTEWINFTGWCGHQHVPENAHGDPGNINFTRIINFAKGTAPVVEDDDMTMTPAERTAFIKDIAKEVWTNTTVDRSGVKVAALQELADAKTYSAKAAAIDIDEAGLAALLIPALTAVIDARPEINVDAEALAEAVFKKVQESIANG
jgi:hypothetical protein